MVGDLVGCFPLRLNNSLWLGDDAFEHTLGRLVSGPHRLVQEYHQRALEVLREAPSQKG